MSVKYLVSTQDKNTGLWAAQKEFAVTNTVKDADARTGAHDAAQSLMDGKYKDVYFAVKIDKWVMNVFHGTIWRNGEWY